MQSRNGSEWQLNIVAIRTQILLSFKSLKPESSFTLQLIDFGKGFTFVANQ